MFLYGRHCSGTLVSREWKACLNFAEAFDWEPAFEDLSDGADYFGYRLTDEQANRLALALFKGIREIERGITLTPKQSDALQHLGHLAAARQLADFAIVSGFLIDNGSFTFASEASPSLIQPLF